MSEFIHQRADHECDETCHAPYVPVEFLGLESLPESEHIDALYDILNRSREFAALVFIGMSQTHPDATLSTRAAAYLLDMDQEDMESELDPDAPHPVSTIVDTAVRQEGEHGYVGQALEALFREQLSADWTDDPEPEAGEDDDDDDTA
jgi:hypothetical protein